MKKSQWVISTTLNNNLLLAKLPPLLAAFPNLSIILVTDKPGPSLERISYRYPASYWVRCFGRLLPRWILLMCQIANKKTSRVMVYNSVPHFLLACLPCSWFRKPLDIHLIAGTLDLDFASRPHLSGNRIIRRMKRPVRFQKLLQYLVKRYSSRYFVPGDNTIELLHSLEIKDGQIIKLHSAIDTNRYCPTAEPRDIDVLIVANLQVRKRPMLTIAILECLFEKNPNLKFAWIGDGILRDEVHDRINTSRLTTALNLFGHIDNVLPIMQRSKLFLLNSESEGLSCATMEAMACSVVPVCSNVGAMGEIVISHQTGVLLDEGEGPARYAEALSELLEDENQRHQLASGARRLIQHQHSYDVAIDIWRRNFDAENL